MKLEYNLINGKEQSGLDESLYLFVGPKISEIGDTIGNGSSVNNPYKGYGTLNIPNTVTTLANNAFYGFSGFDTVIIPESVTSIGGDVFYDCTRIKHVIWNAPTCNKTIILALGNLATNVEKVTFGNSMQEIPLNMCTSMTNLVEVNISNSVTEIKKSAFAACQKLTSVNIPESVTVIGNQAFVSDSVLNNVILPKTTTKIELAAFADCIKLANLTCLATTPPELGLSVFENTFNLVVYVPKGSLAAYQAASGWSDLTIQELN